MTGTDFSNAVLAIIFAHRSREVAADSDSVPTRHSSEEMLGQP